MIKHLVSVDSQGVIHGAAKYDDSVPGALEALPQVRGEVYAAVDAPFVRDRDEVPLLKDRAVEWVTRRPMDEVRAKAIAEVDRMADAARLSMASGPKRVEHEDAHASAAKYRDAGYLGTVPEPVAAWVYAKRRQAWTPKQAADDILAAADRWYEALRLIRRLRLDALESIRAAVTPEETYTIVRNFKASLTVGQAELKGVA